MNEVFKLVGTFLLKGYDEAAKQIDEFGEKGAGAKSALSKFGDTCTTVGDKMISVGGNLTKFVTMPLVGAATAVVKSYADLEQAIGGVETLFKDSSGAVIKNAETAYKRAGVSSTSYFEQITSFSASLLQSTGNDTQKAADIADMAMVDMSDNANKFGSNIGSIQTAYQGFAKQNYTMLDNLKLGYGGTREEMVRLLEDAEKLTGRKYDLSNLGDVYEAIHVIQEEMGVAGTTAKEATETISGSFGMAKASVVDFLANLGNPGADMEKFKAAMIESFEAVASNLKRVLGTVWENIPLEGWEKTMLVVAAVAGPALLIVGNGLKFIGTTATGIDNVIRLMGKFKTKSLEKAAASVADTVSTTANTTATAANTGVTGANTKAKGGAIGAILRYASAHKVASAAMLGIIGVIALVVVAMVAFGGDADAMASKINEMAEKAVTAVESFATALPGIIETLVPAIIGVINTLVGTLETLIPVFVNAAVTLLMAIVQAIPQILPPLIEGVMTLIMAIVGMLGTLIPTLLNAAVMLLMAIVQALPQIIPPLIEGTIALIMAVIDLLPTLIPVLLDAAVTLLTAIATAVPKIISPLLQAATGLIMQVVKMLPTLIPQLLNAAITLLMAIIQALPTIIKSLVAALPGVIQAAISTLITLIPALLNAAVQVFMALVRAIPEIIPVLVGAIPQIISAIISGLSPLGGSLKSAFSGAFSAGMSAITSFIGSIGGVGGKIIDTIANGVRAAAGRIKDAVGGALSAARNLLPFSDAKEGPFSDLTKSGRAVMNTIASGIDSNKDAIKNSMETAFDVLSDAMTIAPTIAEVDYSDVMTSSYDINPYSPKRETVAQSDTDTTNILRQILMALVELSDSLERKVRKAREGSVFDVNGREIGRITYA